MPEQETEVASLGDLKPTGMLQVEMQGEKILLLQDGDQIHAVAATCPHAGAPLIEGVRNGNRIVCPWHKAAFCIRTGAVSDPPALDALQHYDVRLDGQRILLTRLEAPEREPEADADTRCFVIVGAGAAGAVAAQTLREAGFSGRIVMLDQANRVPYDRTVLSKYALSGEKGGEKSPLQTQSYYQSHKIERHTAELANLDVQARRMTCKDGTVWPFDAALLATGATPARPDLPGANLEHVYTLRSRADADAILAQAERSTRAVILGASFIGMEVAASLRERGLQVTVIGKETKPFETLLGPQVAAAFIGLHERQGMEFRLGADIARLEGEGCVDAVTLQTGETLPADLVVIGFGVAPATSYATSLDLNDDGGIKVDSNLRAAPAIYAAGDIASSPHRGDGAPIRVEHWRVAEQQGRVAALNMLGQPTHYDAVPFFWTIQYLKRLDYVGHAKNWDSVVLHGDTAKPQFLVYYVKDGLVAAAAGMDQDRETAALLELFTLRRDWRPDELGEQPSRLLLQLQPS